jgi:hypothetical protein
MKREFGFKTFIKDLEILVQKSPMTAELRELARQADFYSTVENAPSEILRNSLRITAATDPWSDINYQSLYIQQPEKAKSGEGEDEVEDRVILQEPMVKDPMVGVMVLKAQRLSGRSGMVFCGNEMQLKSFASKLAEYEERAEDLDERDFLECLMEAAQAEGLKVTFHQLSPEHGGQEDASDDN